MILNYNQFKITKANLHFICQYELWYNMSVHTDRIAGVCLSTLESKKPNLSLSWAFDILKTRL
jgi:hypothetical protein